MKKCLKTAALSGGHTHRTISYSLLLAVLCTLWPGSLQAEDKIVNGATVTITNGIFGTVIVQNWGTLNVVGTLTADYIYVATGSTLNVTSDVRCQSMSINNGRATFTGTNNIVGTLTVGDTLVCFGKWNIDSLVVETGGAIRVYTNNPSMPLSGTMHIHANTAEIKIGGVIDGNYAGNDPRGQGHDWYWNSDGGGYGGTGGRGYVDSSGGGNQGQPFGFSFTYEADMGGAGGYFGGGGITIEAEIQLTIDGDIDSNGTSSSLYYIGGGAGGGILIRSPKILLNGTLSANGGNGGSDSGGGGGGRIKVFYGNSSLNVTNHASVLGGAAGGGRNTTPGQSGSVYQNSIPKVSNLIAPTANSSVTAEDLVFRFTVEDLSQTLDERTDNISPVIELSTDGFQTISYRFSLNDSVTGWNQPLYYSGNTVEYRPLQPISAGVYAWRVMVQNGTLYSRPTMPQSVGIDIEVPGPQFSLDATLMPTVAILTNFGKYRIDWTSSLVPPIQWNKLGTITATNNPTYYFDVSGLGQQKRFYRAEMLQ